MKFMLTLFAVGALLTNIMVESRQRRMRNNINQNCVCGESGDGISNRIVGGEISMPHIFPWITAIFNEGAMHCGGALINDRYILTAGHCVKWTNHASLSIGLGKHNIEDTSEGIMPMIDKVILHEAFDSNYLRDVNDIALIKLQEPVTFSENVKPVCLPTRGSEYSGEEVKVAGWGRVNMDGSPSNLLRQANLQVLPWDSCRNTSLGEHLTESMLCAYTDATDACQGDSGGPLLHERSDGKYETIGVVSWGIGCAKPGMPGIYVKNEDYLNWIRSKTRDAVYCTDE